MKWTCMTPSSPGAGQQCPVAQCSPRPCVAFGRRGWRRRRPALRPWQAASCVQACETSISPPDSEPEEQLGVPPHLLPQHVAVIMDGNARFALQRGLAAARGHQAGVQSLREVVRCCKQWGIPFLTVYAFSSENWQREPAEVAFLLSLMERVLAGELPELRQQGVRLRVIGELGTLPRSLREGIARAELLTGDNCSVHLTLAISYSGRQDIAAAAQRIAELVAEGKLSPSEVTPALLASHLSTQRLPEAAREPDLIIRTSGEQRLSNFLLWEAAYSELYFTDALWPEFGREQFAAALRDYAQRERRYGRRR